MVRLCRLLFLAALLFHQAPAKTSHHEDLTEIAKADIISRTKNYCWLFEEEKADRLCDELHAMDIYLMPPFGNIYKGRDACVKVIEQAIQRGGRDLQDRSDTIRIYGQVAVQLYHTRERNPDTGNILRTRGVVAWKMTSTDGPWVITGNLWNKGQAIEIAKYKISLFTIC